MNSSVIISKNIEELSEKFAQLLLNAVNKSENSYYLALSGGATPKMIYKYLADNYKSKIDWHKIKFFWGDERLVPPNHPDSNYRLAKENLFYKINVPPENIFRIHCEIGPAEEAHRYASIIEENVKSENNYPQFDLLLLGLGEDGHTASIFSNYLNLFEEKSICAVTEHPQTHQKRITLTGNVINNARQVVFLVTGESKSKIVDTILNKKIGFEKLPASYVNPIHGELIWMLDDHSASLIIQ
ncbi:MAG: 6-phosphogluconolactonase [Ignavibacteriales bacterium]|nr:6-phosphogluconolactonase [Ignavibacteriales bacterium]